MPIVNIDKVDCDLKKIREIVSMHYQALCVNNSWTYSHIAQNSVGRVIHEAPTCQ